MLGVDDAMLGSSRVADDDDLMVPDDANICTFMASSLITMR